MRRLPSFLILALLSLNFYHGLSQTTTTCAANQYLLTTTNECVSACPTATYIGTQGTQQACLPQKAIAATIRPIPKEDAFLIMFNDTLASSQMNANLVRVSRVDTASGVQAAITFLSADIIKTVLYTPQLHYETMLQLTFKDFTVDPSSPSYIVGPGPFPYNIISSPQDGNPIVVDHLTRLDRGLEWTWIAITCLNPYAFLYMNTKLYRETLEVFKRTNVKFGRDATSFFQQNNNKVSGFKAANMFPILLMDNPVSSGWNREEENLLPNPRMNQARFNDLKLPSTDSVYTYDPYALFLDNYGSQITVFFGFIALIIAFEFLNIVLCCNRRKDSPSRVIRLFQAVRTFLRWNILLACIIGSFQTLMYYFMVQMKMKDLYDGNENNNLSLNFWFAIGTFIILVILFPIILALKLRSIYKQKAIERDSLESHKSFGIFADVYNFKRLRSLSFVFALMLRTVIFSALTVFLNYNPVAQVSVMLAFSVLFTIYFLVLRPFKRLLYTIFQLINELVLIGFLCVLIFLAQQVEKDVVDDDEAVSSEAVLIAFWLLIPTLGIIFGLIDIFVRLFRHKKQNKAAAYTLEMVAQHSSQQIESAQKAKDVESGEHHGETEQLTKVGTEVQTTEPLPLFLPTTNEINEAEPLQAEATETGKKTLHIEATPSRRAFPNLSYIEGIDTIIEDVEKEQASANLKDDGNKRKIKDTTITNISMAKSTYETPQQSEPAGKLKEIEFAGRESIRFNPISTIGNVSLNASRIETDLNRTQDKIKAAPLSLDMPSSLKSNSRLVSERRPKSTIFGTGNNALPNNRFLPMENLDMSNMTNRSIMNLDLPPTMRSRPPTEEGYKIVNKRLIFE